MFHSATRSRSARPPTSVAPEPQRWLSPAAAHRLLDVAAEFEAEDRAIAERVIAPSMRQARR